MTETELVECVERIGTGDADAESLLAGYLLPRVRTMMRARLRDPATAADLTQEVLMATILALRKGQLREPARLMGFVHGVARNILNSHLRGMPTETESIAWPEMLPDPVDETRAHETRDLLERGLSEISLADRQVLELTLVEGLRPGEAAAQLGLSAEAVRARKSRALKRVLAAFNRLSQTGPASPLDPRDEL